MDDIEHAVVVIHTNEPGKKAIVAFFTSAHQKLTVDYLNELEYINGFIYANIYQSHEIVKIDPSTGNVIGKLDLANLFQTSKTKNINSLETNGIAYDSISDKILVTGKMWPSLYEIKFQH